MANFLVGHLIGLPSRRQEDLAYGATPTELRGCIARACLASRIAIQHEDDFSKPVGREVGLIAQNLCHAAVLAGHSVLFRSAAALLEDFHRQTPEGRRRKLRTYANVGLLAIDEVGYLSFDDKAADLLYEVVNRRYERKPVILTTNSPLQGMERSLSHRYLHRHVVGSSAASCRSDSH